MVYPTSDMVLGLKAEGLISAFYLFSAHTFRILIKNHVNKMRSFNRGGWEREQIEHIEQIPSIYLRSQNHWRRSHAAANRCVLSASRNCPRRRSGCSSLLADCPGSRTGGSEGKIAKKWACPDGRACVDTDSRRSQLAAVSIGSELVVLCQIRWCIACSALNINTARVPNAFWWRACCRYKIIIIIIIIIIRGQCLRCCRHGTSHFERSL